MKSAVHWIYVQSFNTSSFKTSKYILNTQTAIYADCRCREGMLCCENPCRENCELLIRARGRTSRLGLRLSPVVIAAAGMAGSCSHLHLLLLLLLHLLLLLLPKGPNALDFTLAQWLVNVIYPYNWRKVSLKQGWEFDHRFFEWIARFLSKERKIDSIV